jgi:hypothetical protein
MLTWWLWQHAHFVLSEITSTTWQKVFDSMDWIYPIPLSGAYSEILDN